MRLISTLVLTLMTANAFAQKYVDLDSKLPANTVSNDVVMPLADPAVRRTTNCAIAGAKTNSLQATTSSSLQSC
jgi:hypothetical protein